MVTIHNSDLFKELRDGAKSQQLRDGDLPSQLAEKVVPVMEVNPKLLRRDIVLGSLASNLTASAVANIVAASNRETYITGISFAGIKDATCDITTTAARGAFITQEGVDNPICYFPILVSTAQSWNVNIQFKNPIKIDKNTPIYVSTSAFTTGLFSRTFIVYGYRVDNPNA